MLSTQSHVRLHQVTRFLESVCPITSLAEEIVLCIYIFCRLLYSIVYGSRVLEIFGNIDSFGKPDSFGNLEIFENPTRPDSTSSRLSSSRYFRVLAHPWWKEGKRGSLFGERRLENTGKLRPRKKRPERVCVSHLEIVGIPMCKAAKSRKIGLEDADELRTRRCTGIRDT